MKIKAISIENFGKLSGFHCSFHGGINAIVQRNGWGKSTLAAFIKVMFYGFSDERKSSSERKRYKPWQGGTYGGTITFETGGKEYLVSRTFGSKPSEDRFSLYDNKSGLESKDFSANIGEELFKLDADSFRKTVFIGQNDIETEATDSINAKLGNLTDVTDDIDNYEKVSDAIQSRLRSISSVRSGGAISRLKNEIYALENEVRSQGSLALAISERQNEAENLERRLEENKAETNRLYQELKLSSQAAELALKQGSGISRGFTAGLILLIAGLLSAVAGTVLFFMVSKPAGIITIACGAAVLLAGIIVTLVFGKKKRLQTEAHNIDVLHTDRIYEQLGALDSEKEELVLGIQRCKARLAELFNETDSLKEKESELAEKETEIRRLSKRENILFKTQELLNKAKTSFSGKYSKTVARGFEKYYAMLDPSGGEDFSFDDNMNLKIMDHGDYKDPASYSAGSRDRISLCFRMGLIDAMYPGEKPVIIMDDPFTNLDAEKTEGGMKLLQKMQSEYQIIYLTCHPSRLPH